MRWNGQGRKAKVGGVCVCVCALCVSRCHLLSLFPTVIEGLAFVPFKLVFSLNLRVSLLLLVFVLLCFVFVFWSVGSVVSVLFQSTAISFSCLRRVFKLSTCFFSMDDGGCVHLT